MAQGQVKKKGDKKTQKNTSKKASGPRKGAKAIAPKKKKHINAAKLKKSLQKAINSKIEQELASHAVTKGSKPLTMIKSDEQDKTESKRKGNKK